MKPSLRLAKIAATLRSAHLHMTALEVDSIIDAVQKLENFHADTCRETDAELAGMDEADRAMAAGLMTGRVVKLRGRR